MEENQTENRFDKHQLLRSHKYADYRDLLGVLLRDDVTYTADDADLLIKNYAEGSVN